jgi:hypothetical protein
MADTGWQSPDSYENVAGIVTTPQNAYASDNTYAVFDPNSNERVDYYGFDFSSIPSGSQIDGIEISVEAYLSHLLLDTIVEALTRRLLRIQIILAVPIRHLQWGAHRRCSVARGRWVISQRRIFLCGFKKTATFSLTKIYL